MVLQHGTISLSLSTNLFKQRLQVDYPWEIQLPGSCIFVCYFTFGAIRTLHGIKIESSHGGGGSLSPLTKPWSIDSYTIVLSSNWGILQKMCTGLFYRCFRHQGIILHWCNFCDEGTVPKHYAPDFCCITKKYFLLNIQNRNKCVILGFYACIEKIFSLRSDIIPFSILLYNLNIWVRSTPVSTCNWGIHNYQSVNHSHLSLSRHTYVILCQITDTSQPTKITIT